jgi:hypothetical protein
MLVSIVSFEGRQTPPPLEGGRFAKTVRPKFPVTGKPVFQELFSRNTFLRAKSCALAVGRVSVSVKKPVTGKPTFQDLARDVP